MLRRYGERIERGRRYGLRPGAYVILPRDGKVLTTFQAQGLDEVQLPGGGIDPGEALLPALHREVLEETGWSIAEPRRLGAYRRFVYMVEYDKWAEKLCHIYVARPVLRRGPPTEAGHLPLWLAPEDAVDMVESDGDRAFLARFYGLA